MSAYVDGNHLVVRFLTAWVDKGRPPKENVPLISLKHFINGTTIRSREF